MSISLEQFVESLSVTGLMTAEDLQAIRTGIASRKPPPDAEALARELVRDGKLTKFQARALYEGKARGLVCGDYVLLDRIGVGGMGQVYKAIHKRMNRTVALKLLTPHATTTVEKQKAVKRFYQEVELAARLVHPNIVVSYDAGESNGLHYLVMELVEGQDLSTLLKPDKKLPIDQVLDIVMQAARGLEYAHAQGIIHRDIKPSNLLVDKQGKVKILDMGLARAEQALAGGDPAEHGLTGTGEIMGTVDYMPPEQSRNTREADGRSDIYSLGCTLFRLLTGRVPFDGKSPVEKILAHSDQKIPTLSAHCPGVSPRLQHAFEWMLAKKPEDRIPSMTAVIAELEACRANVPEEAHAPLVTDEPPANPATGSFLSKGASGTGLSRKPIAPIPPPKRGEPASVIPLTHEQAFGRQEKPPGRIDSRVWILAGGGVAALALVAAIVMFFARGDSAPESPDAPPVAQTDPNAAPPQTPAPNAPAVEAPAETQAAKSPAVEVAPTATETPSIKPPASGSGSSTIPPEGIDLLKLIDVSRDADTPNWKLVESVLIQTPSGSQSYRLQLPAKPPVDYDLRLVASPIAAVGGELVVGLVVESLPVGVILNRIDKTVTLGTLAGVPVSTDATPPRVAGLEQGQLIYLDCQVRGNRIAVMVNGQPVVDWQGDPKQFESKRHYNSETSRLSLIAGCKGSEAGSFRFPECKLFPPGAAPVGPPATAVANIPPEGIDLLKQLDLKRDVLEGAWHFTGPALMAGATDEKGLLQFPFAPPPAYDLHIDVETIERCFVMVGLVVGPSRAGFGMRQASKTTGLGDIQRRGFLEHDNPTRLQSVSGFLPGRPMTVVCQVRPTSVQVTLNGEKVVDWQGDPQQLSSNSAYLGPDRTKLFLYATGGARFTRYEVLPPGGVPRPKPASQPVEVAKGPLKPGPRVNLLRLIDLKRDSIEGAWNLEGTTLVPSSQDKNGARAPANLLQLPYSPPLEYELHVDVEPEVSARLSGRSIVGLVLGPSQAGFLLDARAKKTGLHSGARKSEDNETTITGAPIRLGQTNSVVCRVRPGAVYITLNGQMVVDWKGDPKEYPARHPYAGPDPTRLFIHSYPGSRFTKYEIVPLGGDPLPVPSAQDVEAGLVKVKELLGDVPDSATAIRKADQAAHLHYQASQAGDDDALRYALLTEAVRFATGAEDLNQTLYLLEDLSRCFQVDTVPLLDKRLGEVASAERSTADRKKLLASFLELAEKQMDSDRYDIAALLMKWTPPIIGKLKEPELQKELKVREQEMAECLKLWTAAQAARQTLAAKPTEPDAHLALGQYLAVARYNWPTALPHLAKGSDADSGSAAQLEVQAAKDPARAIEIGTAWLALAEKSAVPMKVAYLEHSRGWFTRGAPALNRAALTKLLARFKKVESETRKQVGFAFVKRHPLNAKAFGGHWYALIQDELSWHEARQRCQEMGGDLVSLENPAECQFVYQMAAAQYGEPEAFSFWIGATDEGHDKVFTWANGTPVQFADWATGEPSAKDVGEPVLALRVAPGAPQFKWADRAPSGSYMFVCEWER